MDFQEVIEDIANKIWRQGRSFTRLEAAKIEEALRKIKRQQKTETEEMT